MSRERGPPEGRKWLPDDAADNAQFYGECRALYASAKVLATALKNVLARAEDRGQEDESADPIMEGMAAVVEGMKRASVFVNAAPGKEVEAQRVSLWKGRLLVEKLAVSKLAHDLVVQTLDSPAAESALRLAHLYNEMLQVNLAVESRGINVFSNACPMLLHPLRRLSATRILQVLATRRAERCSFHLIFGLLDNYFRPEEPPEHPEHPEGEEPRREAQRKLPAAQNSLSSNTSVEIYRALTKHLETKAKEKENGAPSQPLECLWRSEEKRARVFLTLSARVAPQLLGTNLVAARTPGQAKLKPSTKQRLTDYYQEVLWGEVGGYLEHILLWWSQDPLGSFPPPRCQNLRDFLLDLKATDFIPPLLVPSVDSLLDAMCCHLTSTSWDQLFRKSLVSAGSVKRDVLKGYGIEGSATGQLFVEMLADLIKLNNTCEDPCLSLEELPLVEQIPVLHRLDHSVHTVRLWASSRCRNLAAKWDLDEFYRTCHADVAKCLQTLATLRLTDHGAIPAATGVQVTVCTKMRAKLVSEIRENVEKLKRTAAECVGVLAKDCRTQCLAILHMCFPGPAYWRQSGPLPDCASDYVEKYLDAVVRPVFAATRSMSPEIQHSSSALVLRILCESWLEYVYLHRVKFSEWGAVQLLTDFGAVPTWLMERVQLPKELLNSLVSHEVLRRCEGVGRLLLRRRGESIRMAAPPPYKSGGDDSADNMPAEMYVPNQEQWLELRAPVKNDVCCRL